MLRCVYFLMIDYFDKLINAGLPVFIFWIAVNIQFSTFSLLVLFYASIDARSNKVWYQRRKIFCFIYIVVNLIFLSCTIATTIVMSVIGRKEDLKSSGKWETKSLNTLTAVIFCFLVTILAFYGWKVYLLMKKGQIQIPFQPQRTSPIYVIAVTVLMFFLFTTRAVYNVLAAFGVISLAVESGFAWQDGIVFMLFFVWEIIPASLVILLFWRISFHFFCVCVCVRVCNVVLGNRALFCKTGLNSGITFPAPLFIELVLQALLPREEA
ncbi:putative Transmembrane 7 superfamily member [Balamuthia mandrillaris]